MALFVDTSVWFAAADRDDSKNGPAKKILGREESFFTTDAVLIETWLLMFRRLGKIAANRFWGELRTGLAEIEQVTSVDFDLAWSIGESFKDADFSIVDRSSFAVMQRLRIERTAAFDHHFAIYRYGPKRDRAFTVVTN